MPSLDKDAFVYLGVKSTETTSKSIGLELIGPIAHRITVEHPVLEPHNTNHTT